MRLSVLDPLNLRLKGLPVSRSMSTRPRLTDSLTPKEAKQLLTRYEKLKPSFVSKRLRKLRVYVGAKKNIRGSPWKLNLVCQFAAGQTLLEALKQLTFCEKGKAPLVLEAIKKTSNLADIRDGLKMSRLEVAECFATHGTPLKRVSFKAKGRMGKKVHKHAHIRIILREIDFNLKIAQSITKGQKKKWIKLKRLAMSEEREARKERSEIEALEREAQEVLENKKT